MNPECEKSSKLRNWQLFLKLPTKMGRTKRIRTRKQINNNENISSDDSGLQASLQMLLGQAGWSNETKLLIRTFPITGRGLCSKKNLWNQDLLLSIPVESLISLITLEKDLDFRNMFATAKDFPLKELSFQALVALYIVFHEHLKQSQHHAYIKSIPEAFTNPFFCDRNELHFLPDPILEKIVTQNQEIKTSYELLRTNLSYTCNCCNSTQFSDIFPLNRYKWAFFAVNSRCVYLDADFVEKVIPDSFFLPLLKDRAKFALAPFLDLFNHSDSAETLTRLSLIDEPRYELCTLRSVRRYDQIFISYGTLPNSKLIVDYGFYLKKNKHDIFEFTLTDIEYLVKMRKVHVHRNKFKFIKDHNLDEQMFVHCIEGLSHNLKVVLYLVFVEESAFPNVLSQTAFGLSEHFDAAIQDEVNHLVRGKIDEYQQFALGLENQSDLTESGKVIFGYLIECVAYLRKFLNNYAS